MLESFALVQNYHIHNYKCITKWRYHSVNVGITPTGPPVCSYGDVRIVNETINYFPENQVEVITGLFEACVDGEYFPVCINDTFFNIQNGTDLVCEQLGYNGKHLFF